MQITLAKTAGFCFGVNRAVTMLYDLVNDGVRVSTLGPIIHNPQVISDLERRGVKILESAESASPDAKIVIRTHGVEKDVLSLCEEKHFDYIDATCPFVKKIHKIVNENSKPDLPVLIAGDKNHPEVVGIKSYCKGKCYVFNSAAELDSIFNNVDFDEKNPFIVVSQTTFSTKEWEKCVKKIKILYTNAFIFDTICNATEERQAEALLLSQKNDIMY